MIALIAEPFVTPTNGIELIAPLFASHAPVDADPTWLLGYTMKDTGVVEAEEMVALTERM